MGTNMHPWYLVHYNEILKYHVTNCTWRTDEEYKYEIFPSQEESLNRLYMYGA